MLASTLPVELVNPLLAARNGTISAIQRLKTLFPDTETVWLLEDVAENLNSVQRWFIRNSDLAERDIFTCPYTENEKEDKQCPV